MSKVDSVGGDILYVHPCGNQEVFTHSDLCILSTDWQKATAYKTHPRASHEKDPTTFDQSINPVPRQPQHMDPGSNLGDCSMFFNTVYLRMAHLGLALFPLPLF